MATRRLTAKTKADRYAPAGSFREAVRASNPERAAMLDAMDARGAEALAQVTAENFDLESPDAPAAIRRRTSDPSRKHVTEAEVVTEIRSALRARGWEVERTTNGLVTSERAGGKTARFSAGVKGRADLYVYPGSGIVAFVEVKRPHGGEVSEVQERWHERMTRCGYATGVATSGPAAVAIVERALADHAIGVTRVGGPLIAPTSKEAAADPAVRQILLDAYQRHLPRARRLAGDCKVAESWPCRTVAGIGFVFALETAKGREFVATWEQR